MSISYTDAKPPWLTQNLLSSSEGLKAIHLNADRKNYQIMFPFLKHGLLSMKVVENAFS